MPISPQIPDWAGPAPADVTKIADLQRLVSQLLVQSVEIPAGGISGGQIASGTITSGNIAAGSITAGSIAAGAIVAGDIAANAVTAGTIAAGAVTALTIAAGAITAGAIAANAITAGTIAANAVTAGTIAANAVGTAQLAAGAVTTTNIAAGAVTASQISVSTLSAVSATMGTVTGGIFQTGSSGARVMFGTGMTTPTGVSAGIVGIDASNNVTFSIDATTGNVVLKGTLQQGSNGLGNIAGVTQNAITQVAGANLVTNWTMDTATPINQYVATNYTTAQDTVNFLTAPGSLKTTVISAGTASLATQLTNTTRFSVTAASVYSGSAYFLALVNRVVTPSITWYNSGGSVISTSIGAAVQGWANQWVRVYIENITAPVGAVTATLNFSVAGGATSEVHNWDNFIFVQQATAATSMIIAGSVTATEIQAGTITGTQIAANSITASSLNVSTLSAITANAGTLTAGSISGVTITGSTIIGGTIETAASGARTVLDSTGFYVLDGSAVKQVLIDATHGIRLRGANSQGVFNSLGWIDSTGTVENAFVWADSQVTQGIINMGTGGINSTTGVASFSEFSLSAGSTGAGLGFTVNDGAGNFTFGTIADAKGTSNFVQLASEPDFGAGERDVPAITTACWFGAVNADGSVRLHGSNPNFFGSETWTVQRNTTGDYQLTLNGGPPGVWAIPVCQCNEQSLSSIDVTYSSLTTTGATSTSVFDIQFWVGAGFNSLIDRAWSFIAFAGVN